MRARRFVPLGIGLFTATLLFTSRLKAQFCSDCKCFTDVTCSADPCDGDLTANCERTVFTPACTGTYSFRTMTVCEGTSECYECRSCANIFRLDGANEIFEANCHTDHCDDLRDCEKTCSVPLDSTKTYVMYVCKIPCPGGPTCEECDENCKAHACLYHGLSANSCKP